MLNTAINAPKRCESDVVVCVVVVGLFCLREQLIVVLGATDATFADSEVLVLFVGAVALVHD